jgi:5-methyltetrahydropteroyltriglutamate--homocysteine methyltransferase
VVDSDGAPFRADHVGSLLRPAELHAARERAQAGAISRQELREVEDRCIREVVAMQEAVGLKGITDGEFRRTLWHTDFLCGFAGIEMAKSDYAVTFKGEQGETAGTSSMMVVRGKVRRERPVMVDHFAFLKAATRRTAKFCIPSPTYLHMRGSRKVVPEAVYPDVEEFWADIAAAYQAEIRDLADAGCEYLQIDDVSFATMCDAGVREQIRRDGEDPEALPAKYIAVVNSLIARRPPSLRVTMHTCRGNFQSMWMAAGGYEAVAEALFSEAAVDAFFLEYDSERAGGFEPLRFVPRGKKVVLGLVSTKKPQLESKEALRRRIDEASRFVPIDNLCLSPQCGFASSHHGNRITADIERRKLERVVEVADDVWGAG